MIDTLDLICFCCRNHNCDNYTIYKGYLICEYCLNDWQIEGGSNFEVWCIIHKEKLDNDANQGGSE